MYITGNLQDIEILIVEDSPTQAEQLRNILEAQGYVNVIHAFNGKEALAFLEDHRPTIIVSDIVMPEMNGYEFCEKVKTDEALKDIPVILLTSLSDPHDVIKSLECGADNFITKPYEQAYLLSRIQYILANMELRKNVGTSLGIEIFFAGKKHFFTAERVQIIDFLISSFESAVQRSTELERKNRELKSALTMIQSLQVNYHSLLESSPEAFIVIDQQGIVRYVNPAAEKLFDRSDADFIGKLFDYPLASGQTTEVKLTNGNGKEIIAEMRVRITNWEDSYCYLASLRDVTDFVSMREKLCSMSFHDDLTGLYNRRGFLALAQKHLDLGRRKKMGMLIFFVDLDDMKWINDNFGHDEGDEALREFVLILRKSFRSSDIIARYGGDEFVILALDASTSHIEGITNRLRRKVDTFNERGSCRYRLSFSMGVAYRDAEQLISIQEMISEADKNMYGHKRTKKAAGELDLKSETMEMS